MVVTQYTCDLVRTDSAAPCNLIWEWFSLQCANFQRRVASVPKDGPISLATEKDTRPGTI